MINQLISFSLKNKLIIGLLTLTLVVAGVWSMTKVPLDAVPDITNNQVQVITQAPNLGTEDIEQFVTYPVEVAMSNLPGIEEIRSISRFGLSVVTLVFKEDMGTYLPRQLVSEKLSEVQDKIPNGFGVPNMGPISTGLGEIYQYTLEVDTSYQGKYSSTELRTIQDWLVRRQMTMVPGVVEVNAFGGHIKQYEVAINPEELRAIGLSITDIFHALKANNQNTGGAYIEKDHYANFIRGEGLIRNLSDIENIVVTNKNGIPLTIKDVAKVKYGHAVRYGAFTKDGKGEAVGGMILMLKGANSNEVVKAVKDRISKVQPTLPPGIKIVPFLERSSLIKSTTQTISQNLIEGALIVIFVLVFLLGNWRGGLIVATTIPLSLLFAFICMNVFDVWANLMSLGAIDFGIIVDGAVIIVEGTVFLLLEKLKINTNINATQRDKISFAASSKMMNSAFFGQLIILIVFIPILALQGVEGKMFKPMALTFMFAMLGVMILCLTYVPMMSAWFLRVKGKKRKSWGDKLITKIENTYRPLLSAAMKKAQWVMLSAVTLLVLAIFTFTRLGGEFIPQLDEGDLAFHIILKPGSSLSESVKTSTKIERIILDEFPEVLHAMTRFGVAEVPTDPMPMDLGDCILLLKPKSEWVSAKSKPELIEKMKSVLSRVPGVNYEFTQPIEMRFNELLTGVREDVAVKLFGEDLEVLSLKAREMGKIIGSIEGVGDMKVEATSGLPQMTVNYDRQKVSQYGLNIVDLNLLIQSAFSGGHAGVIFEGEKRFDLVVRLDTTYRKNLNDIKNLYVTLKDGSQIPLREVADVSYQPGPMQISRDNTNRRTYVGVNVRGRDIQSLVEEIKQKLDANLTLPQGYYIRYGGAFENLERATDRMKIVVPIALGLIFLLIFLALHSFKQSIMIFIAIPMATLGGIFALWLRGMPFSISAGVGFIVLFGVAVLNGLVLVNSWNELKAEGMTNINERIQLGATRRIRPILLTALTDVLGFFPMAMSNSAGAEVQQPLATVVIGGMISATLLTLFILPILYRWMESFQSKPFSLSIKKVVVLIGFTLCFSDTLHSQSISNDTISTLEETIALGLNNNGNIISDQLEIKRLRQQQKTAFNPEKLKVGVQYGQYNSIENDFSFNVSQQFDFFSVYTSQSNLTKEKTKAGKLQLSQTTNRLKQELKSSWYTLSYLREKRKLLLFQDSIYRRWVAAANLKFETEATNFLEKSAAETGLMDIQNNLNLINAEILNEVHMLRILINDTTGVNFMPETLVEREVRFSPDSIQLDNNPTMALAKAEVEISKLEKSLASAKLLPGLSLGYFNQSMVGIPVKNGNNATYSNRFTGVQAGISVPLFFREGRAHVEAAKIKTEQAKTQADYYSLVLNGMYLQQLNEVLKFKRSITYFQQKAVPHANQIIFNGKALYENGAIDYVEYFQNLNRALDIKYKYLETLNNYNQALIKVEYLLCL